MQVSSVAITYHKIAYDDSGQKEGYTRDVTHIHAIPHWFNPFSAQHTKHNHKWVHKIGEIPSWQISIRKHVLVICIALEEYNNKTLLKNSAIKRWARQRAFQKFVTMIQKQIVWKIFLFVCKLLEASLKI